MSLSHVFIHGRDDNGMNYGGKVDRGGEFAIWQ